MDIYEKIKNGDYETKSPYPKRSPKQCHVCNNNITDIENVMKNSVVDFCSKCGAAVKDEYEKKQEEFKVKQLAYNKEILRLDTMLKTDALTYCGIGNHKMADIAWKIATDERDNSQEIVEFLEELTELMVD
jgi:predicted amidophosphoribosyltransferase